MCSNMSEKSARSRIRPYKKEAKWNYPHQPLQAMSNLCNNGFVIRKRLNINHCTEEFLSDLHFVKPDYWQVLKSFILDMLYSRHIAATATIKIPRPFSL